MKNENRTNIIDLSKYGDKFEIDFLSLLFKDNTKFLDFIILLDTKDFSNIFLQQIFEMYNKHLNRNSKDKFPTKKLLLDLDICDDVKLILTTIMQRKRVSHNTVFKNIQNYCLLKQIRKSHKILAKSIESEDIELIEKELKEMVFSFDDFLKPKKAINVITDSTRENIYWFENLTGILLKNKSEIELNDMLIDLTDLTVQFRKSPTKYIYNKSKLADLLYRENIITH